MVGFEDSGAKVEGTGVSGPAASPGSKGPHVRTVQECLNVWGWTLVPDGAFGPKTHAAVVEFQKQEHLQPDGTVGPKTWAALWEE